MFFHTNDFSALGGQGLLLHLITRDQAEGEASWQKKGKPRVEGQPFSALPGKWPATAHVEEL
jgi:hypothetical protein